MNSKSLTINHPPLIIAKRLENLLANTGDMALKRRARRIIEEIDPQPGDRILEIGCGDGFYLHLLINLGIKSLKVTGVDIDENALNSARENLKDKNVKLINADVMKRLPFGDNSFDKIIMSEVCEHLSDDVKGLKEAKRVLRNEGILVVTVPNHNYPFLWDPINWILEHFFGTHIKSGFWAGLWNQHLRLYKPDEIEDSIEKAGLKAKGNESLTWWCLPFNHYLVNLGAIILARSNSRNIVTMGANKFESNQDQSILPQLYFYIAKKVDLLNNVLPQKYGVSVLLKAYK